MTSSALPRAKSVRFPSSDRFGDEPLKVPQKKAPVWGGAAPPGSTLSGYEYRPEETSLSRRTGTGPTPVERWSRSEPGGAIQAKNQSRRPNVNDYTLDLGPGRYAPEKLAPLGSNAPRYTIGGAADLNGRPMLSKLGSNDLMYDKPRAVGKQPLSQSPNSTMVSFGHHEKRLEERPRSSLDERTRAMDLLKRVHKRQGLTAEERHAIMRDVTAEHEAGRSSSMSYMPASTFARACAPSRSKTSAFGSAHSIARFDLSNAPPESPASRAATAASKLPPPPYGGDAWKRRVRDEPLSSPGPGTYQTDCGGGAGNGGFDGTGRLKLSHSRSTPAYSLTASARRPRARPCLACSPSAALCVVATAALTHRCTRVSHHRGVAGAPDGEGRGASLARADGILPDVKAYAIMAGPSQACLNLVTPTEPFHGAPSSFTAAKPIDGQYSS